MVRSVEADLLAAIAAHPSDVAARAVYADWLEQAGDPRCDFVRRHAEVSPLPPDHPARADGEAALSRARLGCGADWLAILEPERAHQYAAPVPNNCACFREVSVGGVRDWLPVELDREPQDTACDAWNRLLALVDRAAAERWTTFAPFHALEPGDHARIVTLPPTIARLTTVTELVLYGSHLVRIPPEIGGMTALRTFTPYTSYRLHWFPYEITRCAQLVDSTVSTCALYNNPKARYPFPKLGRTPAAPRRCSVCDRMFDDTGEHRVQISRRVATDVLPLLVNACSDRCLRALPAPLVVPPADVSPDAPTDAPISRWADAPPDAPPDALTDAPTDAPISRWADVQIAPRLPPVLVIDGVRWQRVDEIEILDRASEHRHELAIGEAQDTYRIHHRLTYHGGREVRARGRAHVDGYTELRLLGLTPHRPVVLVRRADHLRGDYELALTVDGRRVALGSCGAGDPVHRWRNWPMTIAAEHVTATSLVVRQHAVTPGVDVSMCYFWVYQPG